MESISRLPIRIEMEGLGEARGELIRFLAPRTVDAILRILPIKGRAALWQGKVYFEVSAKYHNFLRIGKEKAVSKVESGTIAYWPMGNAFCIFFKECKPYSPVNRIGKIVENLELFKKVTSGMKISIERI